MVFSYLKGITCNDDSKRINTSSKPFFAIDTHTDSISFARQYCATQKTLVSLQQYHMEMICRTTSCSVLPVLINGLRQNLQFFFVSICDGRNKHFPHLLLPFVNILARLVSKNSTLGLLLHLDSANTPLMMDSCLSWYQSVHMATIVKRLLHFHCSHECNPFPLLQQLSTMSIEYVYFCKADFERPSGEGKPQARKSLADAGINRIPHNHSECPPKCQEMLAILCEVLEGNSMSMTGLSVKEVIRSCQGGQEFDTHILVTGSLHMVGDILDTVCWKVDISCRQICSVPTFLLGSLPGKVCKI